MEQNRDSKKAMKMFEDNQMFKDKDTLREEIAEYPHLLKWKARLFADAPIRKAEGYPHLEDFLKQQTMRGG